MGDDIHEVQLFQCPFCKHTMNRAGSVPGVDTQGGRAPEPGDTLVCIRCSEPGVLFNDGRFGLRTRKPTSSELADLARDANFLATQARVREVANLWKKVQ